MDRRATLTARARQDLIDIGAYIGERNQDAAERFLRAVYTDIARLVQFPGIGARREMRDPRLAKLRFWLVGGFRNYLIYYLPTRRGIRVLRVVQGARGGLGKMFGS